MSSDFKLTDARTGRPMSFDAYKMVQVQRPGFQANVAATGIATLDGNPLGDWLAELLDQLPQELRVEDVCLSLEAAASRALTSLPQHIWPHRHLSFVVGGSQHRRTFTALVSNFQDFASRRFDPGDPGTEMRTVIDRPTKPTLRAAGAANAVFREDRRRAEILDRSGASALTLQGHLASINRLVATRTDTVSRGCWTSTTHIDGESHSTPFWDEQSDGLHQPELLRLLERAGIDPHRFGPEGFDLSAGRLRQAVTKVSPSNEADIRRHLRANPRDGALWNSLGCLMVKEGRPLEARKAFCQAVDVSPENETFRNNLALHRTEHEIDEESPT